MHIFLIRLVLLIVGGFIFMLYAANDDTLVNFFCDRYYDPNYVQDNGTVSKEMSDSLSECRDSFRTSMWFIWIPVVVFQAHCLATLYAYRSTFENNEYVKETDNEEDI